MAQRTTGIVDIKLIIVDDLPIGEGKYDIGCTTGTGVGPEKSPIVGDLGIDSSRAGIITQAKLKCSTGVDQNSAGTGDLSVLEPDKAAALQILARIVMEFQYSGTGDIQVAIGIDHQLIRTDS